MRRHKWTLLARGLALTLLIATAIFRPARTELVSPTNEPTPVLAGRVTRIIDGDGIWVRLDSGPIEVRLGYIDAPEADQVWGRDSTAALARRVNGREVALDVVTQDRYHRLVAVVYLADENINAWMVKQGHAWAYRQYATDSSYCAWEGEARARGWGLWAPAQLPRVAPWEVRAKNHGALNSYTDYKGETVENCIATMQHRPSAVLASNAPVQSRSETPPSKKCRIKGNISRNGHIYHVPGSRWYGETEIDETKGERWFCSEKEARDAGWRPPK